MPGSKGRSGGVQARVPEDRVGETSRFWYLPPMDTDTNRTVRPRLLFLGHTLPYPPDRGAALRSYHAIRALAGRYEVAGLFFRHRHDPTQMPLEDRLRHLRELADVELFGLPGERSGLRARLDQLRGQLSGGSPLQWQYADRRYGRRVLEVAFEREPRIVHVDSLALHSYLPLLGHRTPVLVHDGPELLSSTPSARKATDSGVPPIPGWMETVEKEWLPRVAATLVPFESRRAALKERVPGARVEVVSPAVDLEHFTPGTGTGHGLAYVGGTAGWASRDALEFFAADILPRLRSASGVQALEPISWIGPAREGDRDRYRGRGIDVTGYVEDTRPIVRPAACFVVPRRVEGGQTRILQAWAMGKAVVSTTVGCAGLQAKDGENLLIRDEPAAFADAVLRLLEDRDLRRKLGEAGRSTVEARYSWDRRGPELVALYRELESASAG